jgi:hypothetical protein
VGLFVIWFIFQDHIIFKHPIVGVHYRMFMYIRLTVVVCDGRLHVMLHISFKTIHNIQKFVLLYVLTQST